MLTAVQEERSSVAVAEDSTAAEQPKGDNENKGNRWTRCHRKINRAADDFFYRLGFWEASNPKKTLAVCVCIVILCCFGFVRFRVETDGEKLWVPKDSLSKRQEEIVLSHFDEGSEYALILLEHPEDGGSVLTKESMDTLWALDATIVGIETGSGSNYTDLCIKAADEVACAMPFRGVTRFWRNSFDIYKAAVLNDADVLEAINVARFPDGESVSLASIFGNSITYNDGGRVTGAKAMMQSYELKTSLGDEAEQEEAYEWEGAFQGALAGEIKTVDTLNVRYFTGRSTDDALRESVSSESFLFVITYVIMILFVMFSLGRCRSGPTERRSWLGLAGVGVVVLSGLAAYGVNSALGVPFTTLSQILPFILIGIGVDDMFVILASFDHTDPSLPVTERMALGLKRCGVSITYTSLTNFSAFMLGSLTALPAVQYFCLYAGTAIIFDFVFQMTAFSALLAMDANRQKAGRMDWCCCCSITKRPDQDREKGEAVVSSTAESEGQSEPATRGSFGRKDSLCRRYCSKQSMDEIHTHFNPLAELNGSAASLTAERPSNMTCDPSGASAGDSVPAVHRLTSLGRWMKEKYAPALLSTKGKAVVLLAAVALLVAGIYGVTQATQGFDALDLAPDSHFARDYTELARVYELEHDAQFLPLGIYTPEVDYTNTAVQVMMQSTDASMMDQRFVSGPLDSWLSSFISWAQTRSEFSDNVRIVDGYSVYANGDTFYGALSAFRADGENARFESALSLDNGKIVMSKSEMYLVDLTETAYRVDAILDARSVLSRTSLAPEPFAFSSVFIFVEQYLILYAELMTNFMMALAAVAVLSLLVLGRGMIVALVCFTVVMIDVELLGFVYHWGLEVNSITVIQLIMAVGLVVDYMVHIVHYFLHQDPRMSKDKRIAQALGEIGPAVVVGATTTFLGIMPMIFASNVIFRVFFKMFFIIILFGFFHGVVFIPVALSLLPDVSSARLLKMDSTGPKIDQGSTQRHVLDKEAQRSNDWMFYDGGQAKKQSDVRCPTVIPVQVCCISTSSCSRESSIKVEGDDDLAVVVKPSRVITRVDTIEVEEGDGLGRQEEFRFFSTRNTSSIELEERVDLGNADDPAGVGVLDRVHQETDDTDPQGGVFDDKGGILVQGGSKAQTSKGTPFFIVEARRATFEGRAVSDSFIRLGDSQATMFDDASTAQDKQGPRFDGGSLSGLETERSYQTA